MSESSNAGSIPPVDYRSPGALPTQQPTLVRLGGGLGVAASMIGLAIFFAACAGLNGAFTLSFLPVLLSVPGLILSVVGGIKEKDRLAEDTHVMLAAFACIVGIIGGLVEMAVWLDWRLFAHPTTS